MSKQQSRFLSAHWVLTILFVLTIVVRLPFYFRDVIDWDESTRILTAQSVLDGNLPYTKSWAAKPPLTPVFYACVMAVFGESIVAIRFAGTLCVWVTAWLTFLIGKTIWNAKSGMVAAILFVLFVGLIQSGQATMTEHVALMPLVGALYLLLQPRLSFGRIFWAGVLMGSASMVRLNLAYVAVIVGLFLLFSRLPASSILNRAKFILSRGLVYSAGNLSVVLLTFLPYVLTRQAHVWWTSVVLAPLSYANSQHTMWAAFVRQLQTVCSMSLDRTIAVGLFNFAFWVGGVLGISIVVYRWRSYASRSQWSVLLLLVFIAGTALSIVKGGAAFPHYIIQLLPLVALLAGYAYWHVLRDARRWQLGVAVGMLLIVAIEITALEYYLIGQRIVVGKPLRHGTGYEIAEVINRSDSPDKSAYLMTNHIVYWLIDERPLTKLTHPSDITKPYIFKYVIGPDTTTESELQSILVQRPAFIVTKSSRSYLRHHPTAQANLESIVQRDYRLIAEIDGQRIYQQQPTIASRPSRRKR